MKCFHGDPVQGTDLPSGPFFPFRAGGMYKYQLESIISYSTLEEKLRRTTFKM